MVDMNKFWYFMHEAVEVIGDLAMLAVFLLFFGAFALGVWYVATGA